MTDRRSPAAALMCAVAGLLALGALTARALAPQGNPSEPAPPQPKSVQPIKLAQAPPATAAPAPVVPQRREHGTLVLENIPPIEPALKARLERYQHSRQATFLDWLADGSLLIATRFGDTEQVHRVAAPLGSREQLTFYDDPVEHARAARAGGGFVFLKDQGGNENAQLYFQSGKAGVRQLTHGDFIHGSPVWAHDGRRVAFYGNDRDPLSYDVYVADVTSGAAPQLVVGGHED